VPDVVLATCADLPDGDEDGAALVSALADVGIAADWRVWSDPAQRWDESLVVIRSTWDYTLDRASFLEWARSLSELANPAHVLEWNSDKTYLRDLAAAGIAIVPTDFAAPGERVRLPHDVEFVVKPSVGAGSKGAGRFAAGAHVPAAVHVAALHDAGRVVLVQPYVSGVDVSGEAALVYVGGRFSHAVTKGAMLPHGAVNDLDPGFSRSLFVEERIAARAPGADELAVGGQVLDFVRERFGLVPLYARVDLLPGDGGPVLVELELTEPSLFLGYADGAALRFAAAIADRAGAA
jgi:hypothetical protein